MKWWNKITTQFKVLVAFLLIVAAFVLLGFNQFFLNQETTLAIQTSNQAVEGTNQLSKQLKTLEVTPTVVPTATPAAIRSTVPTRIETPASVKK